MIYEAEIQAICALKSGNKEIAIFYDGDLWEIYLGNPTNCLRLGEVGGEIEAQGQTLQEAMLMLKANLHTWLITETSLDEIRNN